MFSFKIIIPKKNNREKKKCIWQILKKWSLWYVLSKNRKKNIMIFSFWTFSFFRFWIIQRISFRPYGVFAFYEMFQLQSLRRAGSRRSGGVGSSSWAFLIVPRVVWSIPSICLSDEDVFPLQRTLQLHMKTQGFCPTFLHTSLESIIYEWTNGGILVYFAPQAKNLRYHPIRIKPPVKVGSANSFSQVLFFQKSQPTRVLIYPKCSGASRPSVLTILPLKNAKNLKIFGRFAP